MVLSKNEEDDLITGGLGKLLRTAEHITDLLIVTHNDPDPDAIAASMALRYLLEEEHGIHSELVYSGLIGRAENRALANYLDKGLRPLSVKDFAHHPVFAMVDTQPGAGNNSIPAGADVRIVIDHHPERGETKEVECALVYTDIGACSTLMTGLLRGAGLSIPTKLATALFYGIKTDTRGLSRETCEHDVEAYFYLQPLIDVDGLAEIEYAQVPPDYFKGMATMLRNLRIYNDMAFAWLGETGYSGMAAEMADILLRLEEIEWVIAASAYDDFLIISVRTHQRAGGANALVRALAAEDGTAGGHGMLAGAQIPLNGRKPADLYKEIVSRALGHFGLPEDMDGTRLAQLD
jgi:nanoRNase/pAp phosphatase (c-di-AMP/oligoRNAs hydrolase)